jgi:hypothetical protein
LAHVKNGHSINDLDRLHAKSRGKPGSEAIAVFAQSTWGDVPLCVAKPQKMPKGIYRIHIAVVI